MLEFDRTDTAAGLELTVTKDPTGGVTGLTPTVAIRLLPTTDSYLDFNDGTFRTSGWGTKFATMSEVGRGHYHRTLNVASLALASGTKLVAEYHFDGSGLVGDTSEMLVISNLRADTALARKMVTNRLEETSGATGLLKLYDDDGSSLLKTWGLTDESGGAIAATSGTPAKRGAGY